MIQFNEEHLIGVLEAKEYVTLDWFSNYVEKVFREIELSTELSKKEYFAIKILCYYVIIFKKISNTNIEGISQVLKSYYFDSQWLIDHGLIKLDIIKHLNIIKKINFNQKIWAIINDILEEEKFDWETDLYQYIYNEIGQMDNLGLISFGKNPENASIFLNEKLING